MGDMINYIAIAIPVFFVLIGVELLVARHERQEVARLNDAIADLSTGVLQQLSGLLTKTLTFAGYAAIYQWGRLFEINGQAWPTWVLGFLAVDFCYYWFHRFSHESNFAWGAHVVHHQSEEYNLSVALRQGALQPFVSMVFYWPLALVGLPPVTFLALSSFNTLYQFWIHTKTMGRLGFLEWFMNTPSHHRVHHGCNAQYIDRNHAGTLIIWDRMFGTFEPEGEEVIYGVTRPLKSWNPIEANLHYFRYLWRLAGRAGSWRDKFLVWVMPPGWLPAGVEEEKPKDSPLYGVKYDAKAPPGLNRYVLAHFAITLLVTFWMLWSYRSWPTVLALAVGLWVVWSLVNFSGVFEGNRWLPGSEIARLAALILLVAIGWGQVMAGVGVALVLAMFLAAVSVIWLGRYRRHFSGLSGVGRVVPTRRGG